MFFDLWRFCGDKNSRFHIVLIAYNEFIETERLEKKMRIGNNFWVSNHSDEKELRELYENGMRLASGLEFSHEIEDDGKTYYCFRPTDRRVDGNLYLTKYYIKDIFDMLGATVSYNMESGDTLTFTPMGLVVNHGKLIKYKYQYDMVYKLQKTQYKGESPYGLLGSLVDTLFYCVARDGIINAGYVK